jgi:hypothetical protein
MKIGRQSNMDRTEKMKVNMRSAEHTRSDRLVGIDRGAQARVSPRVYLTLRPSFF